MRKFAAARNADTPVELWIVEHPPAYTLGLSDDPSLSLNAHDIPVVQTDDHLQVRRYVRPDTFRMSKSKPTRWRARMPLWGPRHA